VTVMMEAPSSSDTSVLTTATRHNIPEDTILYLDSGKHTFILRAASKIYGYILK
jgi:hypothetical protein